MSEITLALEHPSLGCGEVIARYDLSNIQEKAYQQGYADALDIDMDKPMYFTNEQKAWVKDCIISNGLACYERGAKSFAEWLESNSYLNWVGEGNDVNSMSAEEALSEWQKGGRE